MTRSRLNANLSVALAGWFFVVMTFGSTHHNHPILTLVPSPSSPTISALPELCNLTSEKTHEPGTCLACLITHSGKAILVAPAQISIPHDAPDTIRIQQSPIYLASPTEYTFIRGPPSA